MDNVGDIADSPNVDFTGLENGVFAKWTKATTTEVPAPSIIVILLLGISGLFLSRRRK
jgi:hypothetical protein